MHLQSTNAELASQLSNMKHKNPGDSFELRALQACASDAERRPAKVGSMNQETTEADTASQRV